MSARLNKRTWWVRAAGLLAAGTLLAAACGGDDDETSEPTATTPDSQVGDVPATSAGGDPEQPANSDGEQEPTTDSDTSVPAGGASIVVVSGAEPGSLDAHVNIDNGVRQVMGEVYEALYVPDREGDGLVPLLAAEMPEEVANLTYEIALRDDVEFSDGTPFDSESVVFSIQHVLSEGVATRLAGVGLIESVEAVDDYTVQITTTEPGALLPNLLMDVMMYPPREEGYDFARPESVIGTGPYVLTSYTPGGTATLAYNENYRGEQPEVTDVEIRFVPDAGTRIQGILSGEADLVAEISPTEAASLDNVVATARPAWSAFVRLNAVTGVTEDVRVRQAMNYAIDRESIVDAIFGEFAEVSQCTPLPLGTGGTSTNIEMPYTYDPDRARALLDEAGAVGASVDMYAPTGQFAEDRAVSELVVQYLEDVGLSVNLEFLPTFPTFLDQLLIPQEDAVPMIFTGLVDTRLHVSRALLNYYSSEGPPSAYNNPAVDDLIAEAAAITNSEEAQPVYDELLQLACDEAPYIYLYDYYTLFALSDRVEWEPGVNAFGAANRYSEMSIVE